MLDSQSVEDTEMTAYVEAIAEELRIEGPWFAQFKRNRQDRPALVEVNARIGGGSGLNRFGGVNLPLLAVKLFAGQSIPERIGGGPVSVTRSLQFYVNTEPIHRVVWQWDSLTRRDGKVNPRAMACLFDLKNRGIRQCLIHPVGEDVSRLLKEAGIPCFFEEILPCGKEGRDGWEEALLHLCGEPSERDVFVTKGSDPSPQTVRERFPDLLVATPDTLELLGWEKLA